MIAYLIVNIVTRGNETLGGIYKMLDTYFHCHVTHNKYQTGEFLPQDFKEFRFSQISSSAELRQEIHIHSKRNEKTYFVLTFTLK